jgi:hypothetical protein
MKIAGSRTGEKGNVLFLILIAVALFAALSYVVTQSTRSGGGSTEREKNILSSAQMTQYPTSLRTAIIRMVLGGVAVENLKFNAPGTAGFTTISSIQLVFHPQGGAVGHQDGPADLSATGNANLTWFYNANFHIPGVGIDTSGGNEVIAFLPGVSSGICRQVNEEMGISTTGCTLEGGVPVIQTGVTEALVEASLVDAVPFPGGPGPAVTPQGCTTNFNRQASACFYRGTAPTGEYVFFSVLLER